MRKLTFNSILFATLFFTVDQAWSQNVAINTNGAAPAASAMLDVVSSNRGLLIPRLALTATNLAGPVTAPETSLMVYNTATAGAVPNNVFPGYYYWDGAKWVRMATGNPSTNDAWLLTGNTGTLAPTSALGTAMNNNFVGTRDNVSFVLGANNLERMRILNTGQIGVNVQAPWATSRFQVNALGGDDGVAVSASTTGDGVYAQNAGTGNAVTGITTNNAGFGVDAINTEGTGNALLGRSGGTIPLLFGDGSGASFSGLVLGGASLGANATGSDGFIGVGNNSVGIYTGTSGTGVAGSITGGAGAYGVMGTHYNGTNGDRFGILGSSEYGGYFQFNNNIRANLASATSGFYAQFNNSNITTIASATEGLFTQLNATTQTVLSSTNEGIYTTRSGRSMIVAADNFAAQFVLNANNFTIINGTLNGLQSQTNNGSGVGILGIHTTGGFGLFANGNTGASGTKAFHIDHPLDPANKYLNHYSIESPEVLNMYRGSIVLDANGEAIITMPAYFDAINTNFSYQLTAVGAAMPNLFVADELTLGGQFKISGGVANKKVSWVVYAERNDEWVRQYPNSKVVEEEKPEELKGTYLVPALFGMPANMGEHYKEVEQRTYQINTPDSFPTNRRLETVTRDLEKAPKLPVAN